MDILSGFGNARLWLALGWEDVRQKYRRSLLGPFWLTLSMAVIVATLGHVYARLFSTSIHDYLPFLTLGFLFWGFIGDTLREGTLSFISAEGLIRQIRIPLTVHVLRTVTRNLIILAHNATVYIAVAIIFDIVPGWVGLLAIPGLVLVVINAFWLSLLVGMLSTRFRDIPPLVASLLQLVFFVTPIMWNPATLKGRFMIVAANPIYYLIDVVRSPLLGQAPDARSWAVVGALTGVSALISFAFFARFRERIAYWL